MLAMIRMRGAVLLAVALVVGAAGCGRAGQAKADGSIAVQQDGSAPGGNAGDGGAPAAATDPHDASQPDLATDFGPPQGDGSCPAATGALAAAPADLAIDDFGGDGPLDARQRTAGAFVVKEQFDATAGATFSPAPGVDPTCGAAAPGAAHIKGRAADTGATFALVFSTPRSDGKPADHYDASGTRGVSFRVALGDASASKLLTVQVNLAGSQWDYAKDVTVAGTSWQTVTVLWSDLAAAPGADAFSAAKLNQIVLPFFAGVDVDLWIDDLAFVR
jgi:hypothetical protein